MLLLRIHQFLLIAPAPSPSPQVSRAEWGSFICEGCHPDSYCLKESHPLRSGERPSGYHRSCGDGSVEVLGGAPVGTCGYTFDSLDVPWRQTDMITESVNDEAYDGFLSADELWRPECNLFRDIVRLADIDPHVLLVVFLPPLLFESACFGLDYGIFQKQIWQILILAGPAMVVASLITALIIWGCTTAAGLHFSFLASWLAGVINSATDPVAVVALLKELGAAKSLGTLIEGESLLNDGSAVVLYVFVKNLIGYSHSTDPPPWMTARCSTNASCLWGWELCRIVANMALFGVVLGFSFGWMTRKFLRFVHNDKLVEGSIVLAMSYVCFWSGELVMGSSAVLAVVCMGLYMNYHKACLSPDTLHFLHQFYEFLAHGLNTLIFAIAGLKMGTLLVGAMKGAGLA